MRRGHRLIFTLSVGIVQQLFIAYTRHDDFLKAGKNLKTLENDIHKNNFQANGKTGFFKKKHTRN